MVFQGVAIRFDDLERLPKKTRSTLQTHDGHMKRSVAEDKFKAENHTMLELVLSGILGIVILVAAL